MNEQSANQRLIHDVAWACATSIMDAMNGVFRPEEAKDAFQIVYENCRAAIEAAFAAKFHEQQRLSPCSSN
jgi:hypothetical protein